MSLSQLDTQLTDPELEDADPIFTHIVERDEHQSASAKITEARVMGTPVTALCGYTWVPSRNPENHPPCEKCVEIFNFAADMRR